MTSVSAHRAPGDASPREGIFSEEASGRAGSAPATPAKQPSVLLGVISGPTNFKRREMLRDFVSRAGSPEVEVEYVFGNRYFDAPPAVADQARLARERTLQGHVVFVDGRENLPHVGKATEKSAAWRLSAPLRSSAVVAPALKCAGT